MKMEKATDKDINAAGTAMSVLNDISSGYYPSEAKDVDFDADDTPTFFDPDDRDHLRLFYDLMNNTLGDAPGWPTRVIGGMCYVIMFDENRIVDPDADCLEPHPRFAKVEAERDAAQAELTALRQQRDELMAAVKAARDMIFSDRSALAYCAVSGESTFDNHAAGLADYDAVIAQIDSAIAKAEGGEV